jgi:hypothetical protein
MTNEEAIESLNGCIVSEEYENGKANGNVTCDLTREILDMAIAALREQAERSKGCDYCLSTWPDRAADGFSDIWHKNKLSVGYGIYREIKFCPMCGKRLEEHNEAD